MDRLKDLKILHETARSTNIQGVNKANEGQSKLEEGGEVISNRGELVFGRTPEYQSRWSEAAGEI